MERRRWREGKGIVIEVELQTKMESCAIDIIHQVNRGRRWGAVGVWCVCTISCSNRDSRFFISFVWADYSGWYHIPFLSLYSLC